MRAATQLKQESCVKKLLVVVALMIIIGAQALAPDANAARKHRSNSSGQGSGQGEACTFEGYPCSQWSGMRGRW
jgi:hypothetical protein